MVLSSNLRLRKSEGKEKKIHNSVYRCVKNSKTEIILQSLRSKLMLATLRKKREQSRPSDLEVNTGQELALHAQYVLDPVGLLNNQDHVKKTVLSSKKELVGNTRRHSLQIHRCYEKMNLI